LADAASDKQQTLGHHHGYTGRKPARRNPDYIQGFRAGRQTRNSHQKDGRLKGQEDEAENAPVNNPRTIPVNPKLAAEMRQVSQFIDKNGLHHARSWIQDMWLDYHGHQT
jgi:hypothetical protein